MTRRGNLRRILTLLLALLMVTPQVLLRPCCCAREKSGQEATKADESIPTGLSPCCQKRLQAAKSANSPSHAKPLVSHASSVSDFSKCGCRAKADIARTSRAVFKSLTHRSVDISDLQVAEILAIPPALVAGLEVAAHSSPPDPGVERCIQFCRWVV